MAQGSRGAQVGGIPENTFPIIRPGAPQKIDFNGTSQESNTFANNITIVQLFATEDCYVEFGATPFATTSSIFLPSGFVLYYNGFGGEKIAAIRKNANGTLHILEGLVG